jgi:hypothetical protein
VALRFVVASLAAEAVFAQRPGTVVVQVEVTRGGQPVEGLTVDDFVIRDKGKAVAVLDVTEVSYESAAEDLPDNAFRQLFLLFDLEFSSAYSTVQAIDLAKELLTPERLATTEVLIAAHEPTTGLRIEMNLTHDRDRLVEMLGVMRREHESRLASSGAGTDPVIRVSGDDLISARARHTESGKSVVQEEQGRILGLIRSLARLEPSTRLIPGSSKVVVFSGGFDSSVILGNQATDRFDAAWSAEQSEAAARGDVAATAGATRYGGGLVEEALFAMLDKYDRSGAPIHAVTVERTDELRSFDKGARGQNGLTIMSRRTGGEVLRGARDHLAEEIETLESTASIYLLTFQPRGGESGLYRKLDVRLKKGGKKATIAAPRGYYVP